MEKIDYEKFKEVEMKVGKIIEVEVVSGADKLLKLKVDLNEDEPRQIISGIREYFEDEQILVGKKVPFVTNLKPKLIRGLESNGMILAVSDKDSREFSLLEVGENISLGSNLG